MDFTLQDGGYIHTTDHQADFDRTKRCRFDVKNFDLVNLKSVATNLDGSEIELMSCDGLTSTISSTKHCVVNKNCPVNCSMTTSGKQLWWRYERDNEQLNYVKSEITIVDNRPLLLIGGSLKVDNGELFF